MRHPTTTEFPTGELWTAAAVNVRRCLVDPGQLEVVWGEGAGRSSYRTASPALAACLISLKGPATAAQMVETIVARCGVPTAEADALVRHLVAAGLLLPEPPSLSQGHLIWSSIGWRDAAILHAATRNTVRADVPVLSGQLQAQEPLDLPRDQISSHAVQLPPVSDGVARTDMLEVLQQRRTHRNFADTNISVQQLADLLHWTFRPLISAGGRDHHTTQFSAELPGHDTTATPITAFLLLDPKNGPADLLEVDWRFRYSPAHHALEPTGSGRPTMESISELLWEQDFSVGAPAFVIFAINWNEYMTRCQSSFGYRLTQFDLGAFMQTALLVASALGIRTFLTPALDDERFAQILGTEDSTQAPGYMLALGARTRR